MRAASSKATTSSKPAERRRFPRVKIMSRLRGYWVELDVTVTVRDASLGGFSVLSPSPFPVGSEQSFLFSTADGRETLAFVQCRHCTPLASGGGVAYVAGFEFLPQPADNLALVVETLQAITSREG